MTKLRVPDSIEDAVHQAIALLGAETLSMALDARGIRASVSLITKWADPDAEQRIGLHHALAIETLLLKAGHGPVFVKLFERLGSPVEGEAASPLSAAIGVTSEAARLMEQVEAAMGDGTLDPFEVVTLRAKAAELNKRLARLLRTLFVKKPPRR